MTGGNHIRAIGDETAQETHTDTAAEADVSPGTERPASSDASLADAVVGYEEEELNLEEYEETPASDKAWLAPAIAIGVIVLWTVFYGWAMQDQLLAASTAAPSEWARWIIDWSVPVLLVGVGYLLFLRNSRAEATRFASTAALLSQESAELENRLTIVNRELSLAREFLASQSLELESLGRIASERISTHAGELQKLIKDNGAQVDKIGTTSETALGNMTKLRDDLPVVANSARDVSNQIGNAGRTAQDQVDKLVAGFERLNEFGSASETQVTSLGHRVGNVLSEFEGQLARIEQLVSGRFKELSENADEYRSTINDAETEALSAMNERIILLQSETKAISAKLREAEGEAMEQVQARKTKVHEGVLEMLQGLDRVDRDAVAATKERIAQTNEQIDHFDAKLAQRDIKFQEEIARRQDEFETREAQSTEVLAQRLAELDESLAERREAQTAETEKLVSHSKAMGEQLGELNELIDRIAAASETTRTSLGEGLGSLEEQLASKREALAQTETQLGDLTEASIRLLEIIQSGAKQSREDLPEAIKTASTELEGVEGRAIELKGMMLQTSEHGGELSEYLIKTRDEIDSTDTSLQTLQTQLSEQAEDTLAKLQGLRGGFERLTGDSERFANETQGQLREALSTLEAATESAFQALDTGAREKVSALAGSIGEEAVESLERSLRNETAETIGALEQAAAHASGVGREATIQLRDQLSMVNELTGNLEQRVARARELAEEQVNNDFARRMALITDSLNSNAIDITNALATEVSDTAWDAYLKGDRGIFTRRAVRLIDSGESREIADLYQSDESFKANVSRYIHDFEAMLRSMLSTRDGNALSVTVLGSDMGKLYVVLAQSIERFRK
ncbi:ATPase [uncultured Erythrobacter sp.]|uniref:ATPase n=1 Tax=uncultured Erythrobacter sp. TaxID=263913 RepID=UPI00262EB5CC|nr:ATPase [uncultured Erythrobacter sp.]